MLSDIRLSLLGRSKRPAVAREVKACLSAANQARDEKSWSAAAALYRRYLCDQPNNPPIWTQLGHALKESGDQTGSEKAYRTGLAMAPNDAEIHLQLGHLLKLQGRYDEARQSYSRSHDLDPGLNALQEMPHADAATGANGLKTDLLAPDLSVAELDRLNQLADEARDIGEWEQAARHYRLFLAQVPSHSGVWVQFGHSMRELGDLIGAEDAYRTAISLDPNHNDAWFQLGYVLTLQHRSDEAAESYQKSLNIAFTKSAQEALDKVYREQDQQNVGNLPDLDLSINAQAILIRYKNVLLQRRN